MIAIWAAKSAVLPSPGSVAIGPVAAIVRADFAGRNRDGGAVRAGRQHKGRRDARDARFCPGVVAVRRRQPLGAVAAVRSDLRHHVLFDLAAAAEAGEGTSGTDQELAPR